VEWVAEFRTKLEEALGLLTRAKGPQYDTPRPVVLARVEDERSDFPPDQRLSRSFFADLISTYDPDRRQAPVVVGFFDADSATGGNKDDKRVVAGPSHFVGEYLPPLGFIRGTDWHLDHDHLNLYGMVTQIVDADGVGRVDRMVSRGFLQRSIAFVPATNETGGKPDLWHFAVLGGEQPGIPNMASLDRTFRLGVGDRSMDWKALGLTARALSEVKYRCLSILDGKPEESDEMTPEDRAALAKDVAGALASVISPLVESINKSTAEQKQVIVDLGAKLETKTAAIETKADDAAAEAKKAAEKAKAERQRQIGQRLVAIVKSGKAQPAHVERVTATFENAPDEAIEAALATLEALPPRDGKGAMPTEIKAEGQRAAFVDFEERYTIPGRNQQLDPEEVEVMSGLMASVLHLPHAERKSALNRAIEAHYGGPSATALGF